MTLLSAPPTSPFLVVSILVLSAASFPLVVAIWTIQARDGRRHYALSFMVFWLLVVALLGILEQTLLQSSTFPFPLFNFPNPQPSASANMTTSTKSPILEFASNIPLATSDSLSGWTAMALVQSWHGHRPDSDPPIQNPPVMQLCIFLAHISEIQWIGICISLAKWTWYLHRCLSRKLSIVDLRRQVAGEIAGDVKGTADLTSTEDKDGQSTSATATIADGESSGTRNVSTRFNAAAAQATAARFQVHRPIRSLDDLRERLPVVTMARLLLVVLLVRDAIADCVCCCCCCRRRKRETSRAFSDHGHSIGNNHDSNEAWMQWSTICDEEIARTAKGTKGRGKKQHFANGPTTLLPPLHGKQDRHLAGSGISTVSSIPVIPTTGNGQASNNVASDHLTSSLAAKTRILNGDFDVNLDVRFGYDISGRHIRYENDSWLHKLKILLSSNVGLLVDLAVCIGVPIALFLLRFLIKANGRSYDVYSERGGCRISRSSGRADWTITLVMAGITSAAALISAVLSALSLYKFRKQSGAFNTNVETLTPSAKVLRLYKATRVVHHLLILCFILNALFAVARVIQFGLLDFNPAVIYLNRDLDQQSEQDQIARGPRSPLPLFRVADHDRDVVCSITSSMAMVTLFVVLGWTRFERWFQDFFCCCLKSRLRQDEKGSLAEGQNKMEGVCVLEPLPPSQPPSHPQGTAKKENFAHPAFEAVWSVDEVLTQRVANRKHLLRFFGPGSKDPPLSNAASELEQGRSTADGLIERDDFHELHTIEVLDSPQLSNSGEKDACSILDNDRPSQDIFGSGKVLLPVPTPEAGPETINRRVYHSLNVKPIKSPSGRVRYDPSWLPSPPVHGRPRSPRMMVGGKLGGFGPNSNRGLHKDNMPMVPITTTSPPQTTEYSLEEGTAAIRTEIFMSPLPPAKTMQSSRIVEVGTGYDMVLKKLAKRQKKGRSKHGKKTVVYPQSTNGSRDFQASGSEVDGDVGDECEIVTMGSISLDGLIMDDPNAAEYDFMYQKMMVESLAQNITTAATCRPLGGRGRRRSSVIRFASTSPGGEMCQGRSFHLYKNEDGESFKGVRVPQSPVL